ncbi:MAG TPA: ATP-binding protein [Rugosimonospora sp.]|nr:ATP-binding protein [Rugosimonospora sp.]
MALDQGRRISLRVKLSAVYGGLLVACGGALLTVVYLILKQNVDRKARVLPKSGGTTDLTVTKAAKALGVPAQGLAEVVNQTSYGTLHHLLVVSASSLAVFTVLAMAVGWWMAGRVLSPLRRITATARELSWHSLDQRIALVRPRDELKDLADTFDSMLARLETAFESQRHFVANASHELRTPLGVQRAAIQLGLADPNPDELSKVRGQLLDTNRRMERLIDGLLLLAQGESGLVHRQTVALDRLAKEALIDQALAAERDRITFTLDLNPAPVPGDPVLLSQLVTNLIGNAMRYNRSGGEVKVQTCAGTLVVSNTSMDVITADEVPRLFEPFTRLRRSDALDAGGLGLGLSIVLSIVRVHDGTVTAEPRADGGLTVRVSLPA